MSHLVAKLSAAVLALATWPAEAQTPAEIGDEVCIALATSFLTGDTSNRAALASEMRISGLTCQPSDMYMQVAQYRLQTQAAEEREAEERRDRKSTRLNSSH